MLREPMDPVRAKRLLRAILEHGEVTYSRHARQRLEQKNLDTQDAINVLRGGVVEPPEWEDGTWRYRIRTVRMTFVVAFRSEREVVIVTAWRTP